MILGQGQGALDLISNFKPEQAVEPRSKLEQILEALFPDPEPFRTKAMEPYQPRPEIFSQAALSQRPGMAYVAGLSLELVAPSSEDEEVQMREAKIAMDAIISYCNRTTMYWDKVPVWKTHGVDQPLIAFDLEATGLDRRVLYDKYGNLIRVTKIAGICLGVSSQQGYYLPVLHTELDGVKNWCRKAELYFLDRILSETVPLIHNAQYDLMQVQIAGANNIRLYPYFLDTMIGCFLYDVNEKKNGLKNMSEVMLGRTMVKIEELFGETKKDAFIAFNRICASDALVYGGLDGVNTFGIFEFLCNSPKNPFLHQPIPTQIDHHLALTLIDMYKAGAPVDYDYNLLALHDCVARAQMLIQYIYKEVGQTFDIGSPKQLNEVIFNILGVQPLPGMERGKNGGYSTDEDTLQALSDANPHVTGLLAIVDYRKISAAASKTHAKMMGNSYADYLAPYTRMGVDFNATNVPTGRLSSGTGKGRTMILTGFSKKNPDEVSKQVYHKGDWIWGGNSQGIGAARTMKIKLKKITAHPKLDLKNPYSEEVRIEAAKKVAEI